MTLTWSRVTTAAAILFVLILIAVFTRHSIFLISVDEAHHLILVDTLANHHAVQPGDMSHVAFMGQYPPASHWIAALLSPLAGSPIVAMTWVAICCVFLDYVMLFWLAQRNLGIGSLATFALLVACSSSLGTFIGWEVVGNFFYPQLVANVFALAFLCYVVRFAELDAVLPILTPLAGAALMTAQPLPAIQAMGFGLTFMLVELSQKWKRRIVLGEALPLLLSLGLSLFAIVGSPGFWFMRHAADWNGGLVVGFSHLSFAIVPAGFIAAGLLWFYTSGRGDRTDGVIGSAIAASTVLLVLQDIASLALHAGSPYAVKKHLFIVTTLAAVGLARLLSRIFVRLPSFHPVEIIAALAIAIWITVPTLYPAELVLKPLSYSKQAFAELEAKPAALASADTTVPPLVNVIVGMIGFGHPDQNDIFLAYFGGNGARDLTKQMMVRRSKEIDRMCPDQQFPSDAYAIVNSECLLHYDIGKQIEFGTKGNASTYLYPKEWSEMESWGQWGVGENGSTIVFRTTRESGEVTLKVVAIALRSPGHPRLFHVKCNGTEVATWSLANGFDDATYFANIPAELITSGNIQISFVPYELIDPGNGDTRQLGIGMKSLVLTTERHMQ